MKHFDTFWKTNQQLGKGSNEFGWLVWTSSCLSADWIRIVFELENNCVDGQDEAIIEFCSWNNLFFIQRIKVKCNLCDGYSGSYIRYLICLPIPRLRNKCQTNQSINYLHSLFDHAKICNHMRQHKSHFFLLHHPSNFRYIFYVTHVRLTHYRNQYYNHR